MEEEISDAARGGGENQSQHIKIAAAIQSAQSAMLLSSLKQHLHLSDEDEDGEEEQAVIEELMKELVKTRWINKKKMRTCGSYFEFCLQIVLLLSVWTLCLLIAFGFLY